MERVSAGRHLGEAETTIVPAACMYNRLKMMFNFDARSSNTTLTGTVD
jgi:hypothetical protein